MLLRYQKTVYSFSDPELLPASKIDNGLAVQSLENVTQYFAVRKYGNMTRGPVLKSMQGRV